MVKEVTKASLDSREEKKRFLFSRRTAHKSTEGKDWWPPFWKQAITGNVLFLDLDVGYKLYSVWETLPSCILMICAFSICTCAIDWISIQSVSPSEITCWNLIPNVMPFAGGAFERWLGLVPLWKIPPRAPSPLPPCEAIHEPGWFTRHRICRHLDLGLPNLQNSEK